MQNYWGAQEGFPIFFACFPILWKQSENKGVSSGLYTHPVTIRYVVLNQFSERGLAYSDRLHP